MAMTTASPAISCPSTMTPCTAPSAPCTRPVTVPIVNRAPAASAARITAPVKAAGFTWAVVSAVPRRACTAASPASQSGAANLR